MYVCGRIRILKQLINIFRLSVSSPPDPTPRTPLREHGLSQSSQRGQCASANRSGVQRRRHERERHERELSRQQPAVGTLIRVSIVWGLTGGHKSVAVRPRGMLLATTPPTTSPHVRHGSYLYIVRQPCHEPSQRHGLRRMDRVCPRCGVLHWLLEGSTGSRSSGDHPLFPTCRNCGDIKLPSTAPLPEKLAYFFTAATPQADKFHQNFRQYNAALLFTSLELGVGNSVNEGDRKSTRLNSSHPVSSRMPSSA